MMLDDIRYPESRNHVNRFIVSKLNEKSCGQMKLLVCGDVNGQLDKLFTRVAQVNKKAGPFSCLLCCGQFFDPSLPQEVTTASLPYVQGQQKVPIPTYFITCAPSALIPAQAEDAGFEICPNLTFLGKSGMKKLDDNIVLAFLSGKCNTTATYSTLGAYTTHAVKGWAEATHTAHRCKVDILLTCEWPKDLLSTLSTPPPPAVGAVDNTSKDISYAAKLLEPRYHFAASQGHFYSRPPYKNMQASHPTRFIGIAGVNGSKDANKKWLYATNITTTPTATDTDEITENPYLSPMEERRVAVKRKEREDLELLQDNKRVTLSRETCQEYGIPYQEPVEEHLLGEQEDLNLPIFQDGRDVRLCVAVAPNQLYSKVRSVYDYAGGSINVDLTSQSGGQASKELRQLLAVILGVPVVDIRIQPGSLVRFKLIHVYQFDAKIARERVHAAIGHTDLLSGRTWVPVTSKTALGRAGDTKLSVPVTERVEMADPKQVYYDEEEEAMIAAQKAMEGKLDRGVTEGRAVKGPALPPPPPEPEPEPELSEEDEQETAV